MASPDNPLRRDPGDAPGDRSDRRRLEQVAATDLTESRVNEDFLFWLRTKGPNYLLLIMLGVAGVMGWNYWSNLKTQRRADAWIDFAGASLPIAFEEVARTHGSIDALGVYPLLAAADRYLDSIQSGVRFDREPGAEDAAVTPELREEWLREADRLYAEVATRTRDAGGRDPRMGFLLGGLFGRAAVAESRGELDQARGFLDEIVSLAEGDFAAIAAVAKARIESLGALASANELPTRASLPAPPAGAAPPGALFGPETSPDIRQLDPAEIQRLLSTEGGAAAPPQPVVPPPTDPDGDDGDGADDGG